MSKYVDENENLTKGTYKGEAVSDVADEDSEYLQWLLEEGDIDAEDRDLIENHLGTEKIEEEEE